MNTKPKWRNIADIDFAELERRVLAHYATASPAERKTLVVNPNVIATGPGLKLSQEDAK